MPFRRAKIIGCFQGRPFEYVDPEDCHGSVFVEDDGTIDDYQWADGNLSCDCNRHQFLPTDWSVPKECADEILIERIECIDCDACLELGECSADIVFERQPCERCGKDIETGRLCSMCKAQAARLAQWARDSQRDPMMR